MKRQTAKIKEWMKENRWRICDIQRAIGHARHTPTWETIQARKDNRRVLRWFMDNGCPVDYLGLPDDMKNNMLEAA